MKRIIKIIGTVSLLFAAVNFMACKATVDSNSNQTSEESTEDTSSDDTSGSGTLDPEVQDYITTTEVTTITIDGSKLTDGIWAFATIDLSDFAGKTVAVEMSAEMKVENSGSEAATLLWQVTAAESSYPTVCSKEWTAGTTDYTHIEGTKSGITLGDKPYFYISANGLTVSEFVIYLQTFAVNVYEVDDTSNTKTYTAFDTSDAVTSEVEEITVNLDWRSDDVPSLYETYKDYYDNIGFAVQYRPPKDSSVSWIDCYDELASETVREGLARHANSLTAGNEFKPESILGVYSRSGYTAGVPTKFTTFTATDGNSYQVPADSMMNWTTVDKMLAATKAAGMQMRGHVLVWHSQTPNWFFTTDWSNDYEDNLVDTETMTARQEWYIKTVLTHIAEWENDNGYAGSSTGDHIIYTWDVVNEAAANSGDSGAIRGADETTTYTSSRWYDVYKSNEYIINAFRFANKYAPSDVLLAYNDYNEYWGSKTTAIAGILTAVKSAETVEDGATGVEALPARIDVMGMQTHLGDSWPTAAGATTSGTFEYAMNQFFKCGVDIQITEFDIAALAEDETERFTDLWEIFNKYSKKKATNLVNGHGVTGVTIWGIDDEHSWVRTGSDGTIYYPTLFNMIDSSTYNGIYTPKNNFYKIIDLVE
ncbi:MAG: endo-1,4-beta-xylanase [Treponema sp.]|nr:endo-1,4-beta-xylanase [Treponema sp.]